MFKPKPTANRRNWTQRYEKMIDFIKSLDVKIDIQELLNNPLLEFESKFNVNTGETNETRKTAKYQDITFEIANNKYVNIKGSLHKYSNKGKHNYNDFTFSSLIDVIIDLYQKFNINPHFVPINNIEFAVNVNTSFNPKTFIKKNIISHKGTPASIDTFKGNGYLKEFEHSQYYIKIYDKGLQFSQPDNIFRFEVKVVKMEYLQNIGIKTLADLLNIEKLQSLGKKLISVFNELLIIDKIDTAIFTAKEKEIYQNGINPMFWERLKPNSKDLDYIKLRSKYNRERDKFNSLIKKYNLNKSQKEVSELIKNKWNDLLIFDAKKRYKLTTFLNEYSNQRSEHKTVQNDTSNIVLNCTVVKRLCLVTGLDISMQKTTSKFMSISGIKFYKKNDPKIYKELEKRLSDKWKNKNLEIQFREIAHSIRNKNNNPRNNTKRSINKLLSMPSLFNNMIYISKEKLKIAEM